MIIPTEAQEQAALFARCKAMEWKYPELRLLHHIPNGGSRNAAEAANLKRQGVKPGVPDICLSVARGRYHGLYIELKRRKGGRVSAAQQKFMTNLKQQGYFVIVCWGADQAYNVIIMYLEGRILKHED